MTPRSVYRGFLVPMAALGPLAATLGTILSGERSSLAGLYTVSALGAVAGGALEYALNLGAMWVFGLVIEQLAQAFEGRPNRVQALKLAAFGATPYWIGGLLSIVPKLAPVGVLAGLWSLRLYALGLGPLMGVPDERLKAYTLVVGIVGVVLVLLVSALLLGVSS